MKMKTKMNIPITTELKREGIGNENIFFFLPLYNEKNKSILCNTKSAGPELNCLY